MENTSSVSQGIFVFMPKGETKRKRKRNKSSTDTDISVFAKHQWHASFTSCLNTTETLIKEENDLMLSSVLNNLITHMKDIKINKEFCSPIPTEILVTGTNISDLKQLLTSLSSNIESSMKARVGVLWSRDSNTLKHMVHGMVAQFINKEANNSNSDESVNSDDEEDELVAKTKLTASQYTLSTLVSWKRDEDDDDNHLVLILPDFESFSANVLNEFIFLLSEYINQLSIIFVFCVATTPTVVHQTLPHDVIAKLIIQVFVTEPSITFLNHILEKVLFSPNCVFRLGKKTMNFLTDVFLFNTLSVNRFLQAFKYCMMEHYYNKNYLRVCCKLSAVEKEIKELNHKDLENFRKIPSFQKYIENSDKATRKMLLLDDTKTKNVIGKLIKELLGHTTDFLIALKCLHIFTNDLPESPLGKYMREYYCEAVSSHIKDSPLYKQCRILLAMMSRNNLISKLKNVVHFLNTQKLSKNLKIFLEELEAFDNLFKMPVKKSPLKKVNKNVILNGANTHEDDYETNRKNFFDFFEEQIIIFLKPPMSLPLNEVFFFDDINSVRKTISANPRSAIYMGLTNPHYYLECKCCQVQGLSVVLPTMPDVCIAYKLHLEYNKIINLQDWMQAFSTVLTPTSPKKKKIDETGKISKEVQARFTRAVSELQFLGYIKPGGENHVSRLTWGYS